MCPISPDCVQRLNAPYVYFPYSIGGGKNTPENIR